MQSQTPHHNAPINTPPQASPTFISARDAIVTGTRFESKEDNFPKPFQCSLLIFSEMSTRRSLTRKRPGASHSRFTRPEPSGASTRTSST